METKNMKRTILITEVVIGLAFVLVLIFSSMYTVSEQEQAVITQFGKVVGTENAGLHFKIPFVQEVTSVRMTTNGLEFGYNSKEDKAVEAESFMITHDFNFVNVDFYVEWKVSDPVKYLYNSKDPVGLMRNILQAEARSVVSSYKVDDVLTTAKVEIQTRVKEGVVNKLDEYDLGIMVSNISIQDTEPPTAEVIMAFKEVENAKQNKDTEINVANKYQNEILPQAVAEADKIVKEAEGIKEARINEAKGQVARFNEVYTEYAQNKEITKTRMYLEAMEAILPGINVIVEDSDSSGVFKMMDINAVDGNTNNISNTNNTIGGAQNEEE